MKVLITGGAGFIGSHIADRLITAGHQVRLLDNLDPQVHPDRKPPSYLNPQAELIIGDIRDAECLERALAGMNAVIHNAAAVGVGQSMYAVNHYIDVNCRGSAQLWEAVIKHRKQIKKMIVASSMSIYGEGLYRDSAGKTETCDLRSMGQLQQHDWEVSGADGKKLTPLPTPETKTLQPASVYAISKRDQEEMFLTLGREYGIPCTAFRYFNVIGTRQSLSNPYTGVAAIFCSRILNGQRPLIFEDGGQQRDFVHITDVANANLLALENDCHISALYNIGSGHSITIANLARKIAAAMGSSIQPEITSNYRAGDIRHCFADTTKAATVLGYKPVCTIEQSIADLIPWVKKQCSTDLVEKARQELKTNQLLK